MENRKYNLLKAIVEEYVASAEPVGSSLIAEKYFKDLSSATIRNDMAELEEEDLIYQPHPSAGRVPTHRGYKYYLENFVHQGKISGKSKRELDKASKDLTPDRESVKSLAKSLAEISHGAVLIGFSPSDAYYTGIANIFRQPEFAEQNLVYSISEMIDRLDEVMSEIFSRIGDRPQILIGDNNPFGNTASVVLVKYHSGDNVGLIGILGPSRMDYQGNLGLIEYAQSILSDL
ncbi:MAG: hypothetical protein AAB358_02770 [Patescibacteria group bacterium]